ncbi:MFS transporter [Novosphingobium sp.]|uniref:MFS transporter n=1 Tax=Novosphingobium sp. TaxID=1874826 RepID=UPI0025F8431C|nr:MFS transporter [Novosphingobium sp.]
MASLPNDAITAPRVGRFAPLAEPLYRRVWIASLLSNFGQLILGVGAAWEMTRLTTSAGMVALVQSALMLPLMLVAVPAGAIADMFDRRRIAITGLAFASFCGVILTTLAFFHLTSPWVLLAGCALIGGGVALYGPAWQASIGELVAPELLPPAVALGTISYNLARSFGPALGGLVVLALGAQAAFAINAACYLPLLVIFLLWRRKHVPSRLPPERIDRAIVSGARYAWHAAPIRTVLARAFAFGAVSASSAALAPLVAKDLLHGNAGVFGLLLGATGVGAVGGALLVAEARDKFGTEGSLRALAVIGGAALAGIGLSRNLWATGVLLGIMGAANIVTVALLNVSVQMAAPRWVTARALSLYQSALTGGIAIGAGLWGAFATHYGVATAMEASGALLALTALLGFVLRLPEASVEAAQQVVIPNTPEVGMALTMRSGPVVISLDYVVDPANAREFYDAMRGLRRSRQRNGAFGWSLSRDIADPRVWTERYQFPAWGDYLRMRDRHTAADLEAQAAVDTHVVPGSPRVVRRKLERPFGSVRWRADSPDLHQDASAVLPP